MQTKKCSFSSIDNQRARGVVEREIQVQKRRLLLLRKTVRKAQLNLASGVAGKKEHQFYHLMERQKQCYVKRNWMQKNTALRNIATTSSLKNLIRENKKHACSKTVEKHVFQN